MDTELIELQILREICCDICNEVMHNHIDCIVCNRKNSPTDKYGDINDEQIGFILKCEPCGAEYELIDDNYPYKWKLLKKS